MARPARFGIRVSLSREKEVAALLTKAGFKVGEVGNTARPVYDTTLVVFKTSDSKARVVSDTLGLGRVVRSSTLYQFKTDVLVIVKSETVVGWHRAGFRLYWRWRSRLRGGRPRTTAEIRALIHRMAEKNVGWGAPKIHGELLKLGFTISERTVARYLRRVRRRGDPRKRWLAFMQNHREVIVALDFFTVPTVTFRLLYCFLVIEHGRRKILNFNVTRHPTADWVVQHLREAFPEAGPYRYVFLDRDSKFDADVIAFLKATGLRPKRTSIRAPWQNRIAER